MPAMVSAKVRLSPSMRKLRFSPQLGARGHTAVTSSLLEIRPH